MIKAIDNKMDQQRDILKTRRSATPTSMIAAILLTILLHGAFLLFKKAPELIKIDSTPPPMVALLPLDSKSSSDITLLKWMNILDPKCFIKPNRSCGFSLKLTDDKVENIPFVPPLRKPEFSFSPTSPLPIPTESEEERLKKLWRHIPVTVPAAKPVPAIALTEYPIWLLDDNSQLPQLFSDPKTIRLRIKNNKPPHGETVLKTWFFDGDFFPKITIANSCGDPKFDAVAIKTLTFRGANLGMRAEPDDAPVFISVKWYPNQRTSKKCE
jgi:hypothetical protein